MSSLLLPLSNGLRIISVAQPSSYLLALRAYVLVGSAYERRDEQGCAHALEHLILRQRETWSHTLHHLLACGVTINGWTTKETTTYSIVVQREQAAIAFQALFETLFQPQIDEESLYQEKRTIQQERRQRQEDTAWLIQEKLFTRLWQGTSYAHSILGDEDIFAGVSVEQIQRFYQTWYNPNNMLLILIGDDSSFSGARQLARLFESNKQHLPPVSASSIASFTSAVGEHIELLNGAFAAGIAFPDKQRSAREQILVDLVRRVLYKKTGLQLKHIRIRQGGVFFITFTGRHITPQEAVARVLNLLTSTVKQMLAAESVDPSLADALIQQLRSAERIEDTASMVAEQWLYEHCIYDEQEWHDFFEHIEKKHIAAILEDILHGCENIVADGCGLLAV